MIADNGQEPRPGMLHPELDDLEHFLRGHKSQLCAGAADHFNRLSAPVPTATLDRRTIWAQIGAEFFHQLAVVAAALYPSQITLRSQYAWASTGTLRRYGIGYDHQAEMLEGYFRTARQIPSVPSVIHHQLSALEPFMSEVLAEVFLR